VFLSKWPHNFNDSWQSHSFLSSLWQRSRFIDVPGQILPFKNIKVTLRSNGERPQHQHQTQPNSGQQPPAPSLHHHLPSSVAAAGLRRRRPYLASGASRGIPPGCCPPPPPPRQLPQRVEADGSCSRPRSLSPSPPPPLCDSFRSAWSLTGDAAGPDRSHHPRLARVSTRAEEAKVRASCLRPSYPCLDPSPRAARARPASGQWRLHCSPVPPLPPYYLAPGSSNSGVETSVWVGISELGVTRIGSEGACWVLGCLSSGPLSWWGLVLLLRLYCGFFISLCLIEGCLLYAWIRAWEFEFRTKP
jgi:hypothetical protein